MSTNNKDVKRLAMSISGLGNPRLHAGAHHEAGKLADLHGMRFDDLFREERAAAGPPARACARQGKAHSNQKSLTNIISIVSKEWLGWLKLG